jgi:hypothetical protein
LDLRGRVAHSGQFATVRTDGEANCCKLQDHL